MESEDLQLSSPELHVARVRVLDYFGAQAVPEARRIFRFERSMEFGGAEALLLRQLCLHMAFPTEREGGGSLLPAYLSGESRLMLENFPELGFFRDIVFLFKMLMARSRGTGWGGGKGRASVRARARARVRGSARARMRARARLGSSSRCL